jgi:hypothetical protein
MLDFSHTIGEFEWVLNNTVRVELSCMLLCHIIIKVNNVRSATKLTFE